MPEQLNNAYGTTDLELAAFLMVKGCEEAIPPWQIVKNNGRPCLEFRFKHVSPDFVSAYRRDDDGFVNYNHARNHLIRVCKTEMENAVR